MWCAKGDLRMAKGEGILRERLEKVKAKLDEYQKKYPTFFSFKRIGIGDSPTLIGDSPSSEEYREIEELREERNTLVQKLDGVISDNDREESGE